ncbi:MAG: DUF559 domain-containing protein [Ruminococcaceae bacterium]|nr:DUF559 domain-containing protein [Oscillospiraceae bacterium]
MNRIRNAKLTNVAKALRRQMTKEERHLWYDFLKLLPQTVNRQKVIGRFVVDFYCAEARLVIEVDGSGHYTDEKRKADAERDEQLAKMGISVVRYSNSDIQRKFDQVCADILQHIQAQT